MIWMLFDELIVYFRVSREHLKSAPAAFNRRLYLQDGMIPKYTGYIPRKLNLYSSKCSFKDIQCKYIDALRIANTVQSLYNALFGIHRNAPQELITNP